MSPDAGQAHQHPQCLQTSLQVNVGEQYFKRSQYHVWLFCMNFHKSFKTYPKTHLITLVISKTDQVINVRYDKIVKGVKRSAGLRRFTCGDVFQMQSVLFQGSANAP